MSETRRMLPYSSDVPSLSRKDAAENIQRFVSIPLDRVELLHLASEMAFDTLKPTLAQPLSF